MKPRRLILISVAWTLLMLGAGILGIRYVTEHPVGGRSAADRAGRLGTGLGVLTVAGYAVLWLPYAAKVGKQRRAERSRE